MAEKSHGVLLQTTVSSTLTTIPGVKDIDFNPGEWGEYDATNHGSSNEEEIIPDGVRAGKTVSFDMDYDEDNSAQSQLVSDFDDQAVNTYNIIAPGTNGETFTFNAYVMSMSYPLPVRGAKVRSVTLRITGAITTS